MRRVEKSIDIGAARAAAWRTLTRFEEYAEWNPFFRWALGDASEGASLRLYGTPPGARPFTFRPRVVSIRPEEELRLAGPIRPFGLLRGELRLRLAVRDGGGTRFTASLDLHGLLLLFGGSDLAERIGAGLEGMNRALRERLDETAGGGEGR